MKKRKLTAAFLAFGLSASIFFQTPALAAAETADAAAEAAGSITTNAIPGWPQGPDITSAAAVIMEASTGTVLYAKNMDQTLYPSSAVKIMTCLLALENSSPDEQVTMTATGTAGVTDGGANIASQVDEVFTMEQCLYAIMVASANDIALQVAEHVGGSVETFVEKMNARAQELGCTNTLFTNPTGLPDENQHVTAHDMALIMKAAISNETFLSVASATSYTIPATNLAGGDRVLTSSFTMTNNTTDAYYEGCLGGKEGYTEASGSTLVCAAQRNGITLISVVLNGASGQTDDEAISLLDYGFGNFRTANLGDNDFSVMSGGTVLLPADASADSLTAEDTPADGQINRRYLFGGTQVGTAVVDNTEETDATTTINGEANMAAAQDFSDSRTMVPYYIIGGIGLLLLLFLLYRAIKIAKA